MLRLTESNRLEVLAERLVAALDVPSAAPLVPETVVVPNFGMARWLSLSIARAHGVCANVRFVLPAKFVWEVLGRVVGSRAEVDVFRSEEHTSELQSQSNIVCRLLLEKNNILQMT